MNDHACSELVLLRDLCSSIDYGYTASASPEPVGPKFLRITDIVKDQISWNDVPHCSIDPKNLQKFRLAIGDIVVARTGATSGYAKRIKSHPDAVFASYLVRLKINEKADDRFIGQIVESDEYKRFVMTHISGSAQPQANAQVLTAFPLRLPSVAVQRKIAAVLSAYDDLIENNTRRIQILEEMAQALYREWFVHFRFPGHEKSKMVESELGMVPEGWEVRKLSQIALLVMGQSPTSDLYNHTGKGLPFHQGVADFGTRFPSDRVFTTALNRAAEKDDILLSVRAPVGRINIATKKIVIGRGLSAIRSRSGQQCFLFQQLKDRFQEEDSMGSGAIFASVTKADMENVHLIVPLPRHAYAFEEMAQPIFRKIELLNLKTENLRQTRDLLLPKLISGELDVEGVEIKT